MSYIVFIAYLIFFCWLVTKIPFFKNSGLGKQWLVGLFVVRIAAGLAFAWFYALPVYINDADTYHYFRLSVKETQWLLHNPFGFIKDLFTYGYNESGGLFAGKDSYWNDLKNNVIIKLLAVCNVFTGSNYYADIIFFNFLFFFGPVAFFRLLKKITNAKKLWLIIPVFLWPSFAFYCSGIHKDGFIFLGIALIIYFFYLQIEKRKIIIGYSLLIVLCLVFLFAIRNFIALLLLPALFAWWLAEKYPAKKWLVFFLIYGFGIFLFFFSFQFSSYNFAQFIINKQQEFLVLSGDSEIPVPVLQPTVSSFIHYFSSALDLIFLRPYPSDIKNFGYVPPLIENIFVLIILLLAVVSALKKRLGFPPPFIFCLFFSFSVLMIEAYTVPFLGALVRYKTDVITLCITPFFLLAISLFQKQNKY
ncbi:MAG: hypothetical protein ACTHJ5_00360 [Ilyomonas sp.]